MDLEKNLAEKEGIKTRVRAQEEERLVLEGQFEAKDEQIAKLTQKLEKLWQKYKNANAEVDDLQREFQQEREDMLNSIRELTKELKHKTLIIDYFIPQQEYARIEERSRYVEEEDVWEVQNLELAGNAQGYKRRPESAFGFRYPTTEFTRHERQRQTDNPRFRHRGILQSRISGPESLVEVGELDNLTPLSPHFLNAVAQGQMTDDDSDFMNGGIFYNYDQSGYSGYNGAGSGKQFSKLKRPSSGRPGTASRRGRRSR